MASAGSRKPSDASRLSPQAEKSRQADQIHEARQGGGEKSTSVDLRVFICSLSSNVWKASKLGIRVFDQQKNARKGHLPHSWEEEFIAFPTSIEPNAVMLSVSSVKGRGNKH
jgi:hypothetical protein